MTRAETIVVATVSGAPKEETAVFQPFADYLAKGLAGEGIRAGRVAIAASMDELAAMTRRGEVDVFLDSPFPATLICLKSGGEPILRRWKKGVAEYHSVIFARRDAGIAELKDLVGQRIAFGEPYSSSTYLLPKLTLLRAGVPVTQLTGPNQAPPADKAGYAFSGDEESTMYWVLQGKVVAGALSEKDYNQLADNREKELTVLARSPDVPRHVVAVAGTVTPERKAAIEKVLLGAENDPAGKVMLAGFEKTVRFDRFPAGNAAYRAEIEEMLKLLGEIEGK